MRVTEEIETVFVVDDDPSLRDALTLVLEDAGYHVQACPTARDFLEACDERTAGCAILDIGMPDMDGLALQRATVQRGIRLPILFLTGQADVPTAVRALKAGAMDFLEKPISSDKLLERVRAALAVNAAQREEARRRALLRGRLDRLTPREREILTLVVGGLSSKEIGRRLNISFRTVEGHRRRIAEKARTRSLPELAEMARVCGLS
ncbi:MAG: response regulator [Gammaproteobacteria bacterium]|jgi:RNA polymerase sigma factor (sigma-70 family)